MKRFMRIWLIVTELPSLGTLPVSVVLGVHDQEFYQRPPYTFRRTGTSISFNKKAFQDNKSNERTNYGRIHDEDRDDYGLEIARPNIDNKAHFELKGQFLKELRDNTFSGSDNEDANEHIRKVLESVDLFHIPEAADAKKAIRDMADHSQKCTMRCLLDQKPQLMWDLPRVSHILCQHLSASIVVVIGRDLDQTRSSEYGIVTCIFLRIQAELSMIALDLFMGLLVQTKQKRKESKNELKVRKRQVVDIALGFGDGGSAGLVQGVWFTRYNVDLT
ncbi:hypothetical protein Tco_1105972 [Tanacetum coccineum]